MKVATFLFFLLALIFEDGNASPKKCKELLSPAPTDPLQVKILEHESQIKKLMGEYEQKLGPYRDPFALVWTPEEGDKIFTRLSERPQEDDEWIESSLSIINKELRGIYRNKDGYDENLVDWIVKDAASWLNQSQADRVDLQSNLLALKYTTEYLRRFKETEKIIDRDGEKQKGKSGEKQKDQQGEQQQDQDQSPEYPDLPKEYKPFSKDTKQGQGGKQKKHRVAEVNFQTPFFVQRYFSDIVRGRTLPFQEALLPTTPSSPSRTRKTGFEMTVRTFGKGRVDLFLPSGFKPLQPSDPRASISRSESGGYSLELKDNLPEVHIPLVEDSNISMMPHLREVYTRLVGFSAEEWPDQVQADILGRFSKEDGRSSPLRVAQAIADHIATEYLYSVGARPETDPVEALKAGSFQCDMAAYSMVALLRDVYGIPSRVVGGIRAKKYRNGQDRKSYLVVPDQAHAWVEVFHDGRWHTFDPTPVKKDKKEDLKGEDNEYSDNRLDNTPRPQQERQSGSEQSEGKQASNEQSGDGQNSKKQDHRERLDQNTQKRTAVQKLREEQQKAQREKDKGNGKDQNKDNENEGGGGMTSEELAEQLELGSLELEPKLDRNALLERAMRVVLRNTLDPTQKGSDIQNRLNQISSLLRRFHSPGLKQVYQGALSAHQEDHPELKKLDR